MRKKKLTDRQLVDALGGTYAVQKICRFKGESAVRNWFLDGRCMPHVTRLALLAELDKRK